MRHELIFRNATLISGDRSARRIGDLAVDGARIAAIGDLTDMRGQREIDLSGKVLTPGFIDVHTHDDSALLAEQGMDARISQGVTMVIAGNCRISLAPLRLDGPPSLLHQLPLRAHAEERLDQQGPQQLLRRDRGSAVGRLKL